MAGSKKAAGAKKAAGSKKGSKKAAGSKKAKSVAGASAPVSFAKQIAPLFRTMDVQCMRGRGVFLTDYDYMKVPGNAEDVLQRLLPDASPTAPPRMPYGGPYWTDGSIQLFKNWIAGGYQP